MIQILSYPFGVGGEENIVFIGHHFSWSCYLYLDLIFDLFLILCGSKSKVLGGDWNTENCFGVQYSFFQAVIFLFLLCFLPGGNRIARSKL